MRGARMTLPLIDIIPRLRRMISRPRAMTPALLVSAASGLVEGLALASLLPAVSSLATDGPWWGLTTPGWLAVLTVLTLAGVGLNFVKDQWNYRVAMDFLRICHGNLIFQFADRDLHPLGGAEGPAGYHLPLAGCIRCVEEVGIAALHSCNRADKTYFVQDL